MVALNQSSVRVKTTDHWLFLNQTAADKKKEKKSASDYHLTHNNRAVSAVWWECKCELDVSSGGLRNEMAGRLFSGLMSVVCTILRKLIRVGESFTAL